MQRQQWTKNKNRSSKKKHTKQQQRKSTLPHWWTSVKSAVRAHRRRFFFVNKMVDDRDQWFFKQVSHTCSSNYSVCDGRCTHTLLSHAHFSALRCVHPHIFMRVNTHAWLKDLNKVFAVCMSHISVSLSLSSCVTLHPCCSRTVTSTPRSRPHRFRRAQPDPKARVKRTTAWAPRSLATWPIPTHSTELRKFVVPKKEDQHREAEGFWRVQGRSGHQDDVRDPWSWRCSWIWGSNRTEVSQGSRSSWTAQLLKGTKVLRALPVVRRNRGRQWCQQSRQMRRSTNHASWTTWTWTLTRTRRSLASDRVQWAGQLDGRNLNSHVTGNGQRDVFKYCAITSVMVEDDGESHTRNFCNICSNFYARRDEGAEGKREAMEQLGRWEEITRQAVFPRPSSVAQRIYWRKSRRLASGWKNPSQYFLWGMLCARRKQSLFEEHLGQPSSLIEDGRHIEVSKTDNHYPLVVLGVRALDDQKQTHAVVDHERRVETELPGWLHPFTWGVTSGFSSSTEETPADVPILRIFQRNPFQTEQEENTNYSLIFRKTRTRCRRTKPKDLGLWTSDHKVLNEDQESMLHKYAVVAEDLATPWIHGKPNQLKRRTDVREHSYIQKKIQDPLTRTILWNLSKLVKSWIGIMRDPRGTDPKHMELQNKLQDEWQKALSQHWFSLDFKKTGGQRQGNVIAIFEMCKTFQQMARHIMNVGSPHHLKGRIYFFGTEVNFHPTSSKAQGRKHQSGRKVFPGIFMGWKRFDWWSVDDGCGGLHLIFLWKSLWIPMQNGRNLARGTAVICKVGAGITGKFSFLKKTRDPDVEVRPNFYRTIENFIFRNLVVRRNSSFLRTIFRYLWITLLSRDENEHLMYFKKATIDFVGTWMETSYCLNRGSPWHVSRCSTKIHQNNTCGSKTD